jgi:hypothetical protein
VVVDCWQSKESWSAAQKAVARFKVFWQHGASIPIGGSSVGDVAYKPGSPYTHFWNVSKACANYLSQKYRLNKEIDIVHPFFDSSMMMSFVAQTSSFERKGLLILARRGQKYIPEIISKFCPKNKVTIIYGFFSEREFYEELIRHQFFISIDHGINQPTWLNKMIVSSKKIVDKDLREREKQRNRWLVPTGHLLGFPMSAAEAAWLKTGVIGFAMGGGLEWMDQDNCFLARDRDETSLLNRIDEALNTTSKQLCEKLNRASLSVSKFTKEHTWNQIQQSLRISL